MISLILAALIGSHAIPGQPFESLALSWTGAHADVRVRVSVDGVAWSEWIAVPIDADLTDRDDDRFFSGIMHFGREVRFVETNVEDAKVTVFALPEKGPRRVIDDTYQFGPVTVRSRDDWGCPDGEGAPLWTPAYTPVTHAIVHHTAGANSVPDWAAEVRSIWFFHTYDRGWGDIGYNFLIDPNGVVYEGRAGGSNAIAAHFSCRNTNTVGVALLGTFTDVAPTAAAQASLKQLLAELCRRNALDPTGSAMHVPSGLMMKRISGHRDGNDSTLTCSKTECPGDVLYAMLPEIRDAVAMPAAAPRRRAARK